MDEMKHERKFSSELDNCFVGQIVQMDRSRKKNNNNIYCFYHGE